MPFKTVKNGKMDNYNKMKGRILDRPKPKYDYVSAKLYLKLQFLRYIHRAVWQKYNKDEFYSSTHIPYILYVCVACMYKWTQTVGKHAFYLVCTTHNILVLVAYSTCTYVRSMQLHMYPAADGYVTQFREQSRPRRRRVQLALFLVG